MLNNPPLFPGKVQENQEVCCRQTIIASEGHPIVRSLYAATCLPVSRLCSRKENQLKLKKKDEEAAEQAVRRVYVTFHTFPFAFHF